MNLLDVVLFSERLKIVPIGLRFSHEIFTSFTKDVTTYMYPRSPVQIEETIDFIKDALRGLEQGTNLQMVILDKETEEFLGCLGLHEINTKTPEIGIWLKKERHGHNYGKEAVRSLVNWAKRHLNYEYLRYPVDKRNIASRKIPESLGGVIKNEFKATSLSGTELDEVEYWIYREDVGHSA